MPRHRLHTPATALMLALALLLLACETDGGPSIGNLLGSTTPTPAPSAIATSIDVATTSTPTPPAGTSDAATPAATSAGPPERPRVLWMLRDHGGTNLAVVRFGTNVETTAVLSVVGAPGQPTGVEPQGAPTFATQHTISTPLGMGQPTFLTLEVTDHQGAKASASLEYGATIVGMQYWARIDNEKPAFAWTAPFKGAAKWTNIVGATAPPVSVQLFVKKAGCTTAEQCQATYVSTFNADTRTTIDGAERHSIPVEFPPTPEQDFQLLYTATVDGPQPLSMFYQRDITRAAAVAGRE